MSVMGYTDIALKELDACLASGQISVLELPPELVSAWAAWEPEPPSLSTYSLSIATQRAEFLYQYCAQGEPVLLAAVSHIWDSLAEPRAARCTQIGLASGAGGHGRFALVLMLRKLLRECNEIGAVLPDKAKFDSFADWNQAVSTHFASGEAQERSLCKRYADILDGSS